jgi:hypothetical protein
LTAVIAGCIQQWCWLLLAAYSNGVGEQMKSSELSSDDERAT